MRINLSPVKQGSLPTVEFTWPLPDGHSPDDLTGMAITGVMEHLSTQAVTTIRGSLTVVDGPTRLVAWAMAAEDTGTPGAFAFVLRASLGDELIYTLDGSLEIEENPSVTAVSGAALVGVPTADAAWLTTASARVADGDDVATRDTDGTAGNLTVLDASGNAVDAGYAASAFDAAGAASAAQDNAIAAAYLRSDASYLHTDWYDDDIAATIIAAQAGGVPVVRLNPEKTYPISATLTIPPEIMLDGGTANNTSQGITAVRRLAKIYATGDISGPMIKLSDFSGIRGVWLDGNNFAVSVGIEAANPAGIVIRPQIIQCFIDDVIDGIKLGGATYASIKENGFYDIGGIGIDALASYGGVYYGGNHCFLAENEYKGTTHHLRLEGIFVSNSDDFEGSPTTATIELAGTNVSQLSLYSPYVEASKVFLKNSTAGSFFFMLSAFVDGTSLAGSVFADFAQPLQVFEIRGCKIQQFVTIFTGTVPINSFILPRSNSFQTYTTFGLSAMTLYSVGYARGMDIQTANEISYSGDEKEWTSATVASFDCMLAKFHRMNLTGAATINPSTAAGKLVRGHQFTIQFDGNTTLAYHASTTNKFLLAKGANCTPPANAVISFITDSGLRVKEIGDYTARL